MKDSKSIISHLVQQPSLKKYEQMRCYEKYLALLPQSFTAMIRFVYTKNHTLFFVLNHPCAKMEFNYKRNLIKSLLKEFNAHFPDCHCLHVQDIQAFVTNKVDSNVPAQELTSAEFFYAEQASGTFDIQCDDPKLQSLFEAIKQTIQTHSC